MATVVDTLSNQKFLVSGVDSRRALLAVFLREVLYRRSPETVTWDVVEAHLPEYESKKCFRTRVIRDRQGGLNVLTELWKYVVREGLQKPPPPEPEQCLGAPHVERVSSFQQDRERRIP